MQHRNTIVNNIATQKGYWGGIRMSETFVNSGGAPFCIAFSNVHAGIKGNECRGLRRAKGGVWRGGEMQPNERDKEMRLLACLQCGTQTQVCKCTVMYLLSNPKLLAHPICPGAFATGYKVW